MSLFSRFIPVFLIVAVLAAQTGLSAQPTGSRCLKIVELEMCIDPALAASTDKEVGAKKCFDAVLGCTTPATARDNSQHYNVQPVAIVSGLSLALPWKPPRLTA